MTSTLDIFVQAVTPPHYGGWIYEIDPLTPEELAELIATATEHAEEWRISDADGFGFELPEHLSPPVLRDIAAWCCERGNADDELRAACAALVTNEHSTIDADALRTIRARFIGAWEEPGDYARHTYESEAEHLGFLGRYVDYARLEQELVLQNGVALVEVEGRRFFFTPS